MMKNMNIKKEVNNGMRCPYTLKIKNCRDCAVIGGKGWKCKEKKVRGKE
jgi:hypothetical protein